MLYVVCLLPWEQEKYRREQEKLKQEWERAQREVAEEERKYHEEVRMCEYYTVKIKRLRQSEYIYYLVTFLVWFR